MIFKFLIIGLALGCRADNGAPPNFEADMLLEHNAVRKAHGAQLLQLDPKLSSSARVSAKSKLDEYLANHTVSHPIVHEGEKFFSDNIWAVQSTTPTIAHPRRIVSRWAEEEKLHDWSKNEFDLHTGHFTQLVWNASTHVGFGIAQGVTMSKNFVTIVVARYSPPGNVVDKKFFLDNVFPKQNIDHHLALLNQDAASLKKIIANLTSHVEKLDQAKGSSTTEAPLKSTTVTKPGAVKAGSRSIGLGDGIQSLPGVGVQMNASVEAVGVGAAPKTSTDSAQASEITVKPEDPVTSNPVAPPSGRAAAGNDEPEKITTLNAKPIVSAGESGKSTSTTELSATTPESNKIVDRAGEPENEAATPMASTAKPEQSPEMAKASGNGSDTNKSASYSDKSGRASASFKSKPTIGPQTGRGAATQAQELRGIEEKSQSDTVASDANLLKGKSIVPVVGKIGKLEAVSQSVDLKLQPGNGTLTISSNTTLANSNDPSKTVTVVEKLTASGSNVTGKLVSLPISVTASANATSDKLKSLPISVIASANGTIGGLDSPTISITAAANATLPRSPMSIQEGQISQGPETPGLVSAIPTAKPELSINTTLTPSTSEDKETGGNLTVTPMYRSAIPDLMRTADTDSDYAQLGRVAVLKAEQVTQTVENGKNMSLNRNASTISTTPELLPTKNAASGNETQEVTVNVTVTPINRSVAPALPLNATSMISPEKEPVGRGALLKPETPEKAININLDMNISVPATKPELLVKTNETAGNKTKEAHVNLALTAVSRTAASASSISATDVINPKNEPAGRIAIMKPDQLTKPIENAGKTEVDMNSLVPTTKPELLLTLKANATSGNKTEQVHLNLSVTGVGRSGASTSSINATDVINPENEPAGRIAIIKPDQLTKPIENAVKTEVDINSLVPTTKPVLLLDMNTTTGNKSQGATANLTGGPIGTSAASASSINATAIIIPKNESVGRTAIYRPSPGIQIISDSDDVDINIISPNTKSKIKAKPVARGRTVASASSINATAIIDSGNEPVGRTGIMKPGPMLEKINNKFNMRMNSSVSPAKPELLLKTNTAVGNESQEAAVNLTVTPITRSAAPALPLNETATNHPENKPVGRIANQVAPTIGIVGNVTLGLNESISVTKPNETREANLALGTPLEGSVNAVDAANIFVEVTNGSVNGTGATPASSDNANTVGQSANDIRDSPVTNGRGAIPAVAYIHVLEEITRTTEKSNAAPTSSDNAQTGGQSANDIRDSPVTSGRGALPAVANERLEESKGTTEQSNLTTMSPVTTSMPIARSVQKDVSKANTTRKYVGKQTGRNSDSVDFSEQSNATNAIANQSVSITSTNPKNSSTTDKLVSLDNGTSELRDSLLGRGVPAILNETIKNNAIATPDLMNSTAKSVNDTSKNNNDMAGQSSRSVGGNSGAEVTEAPAGGLPTSPSIAEVGDSAGKDGKLKKHGRTEATTRMAIEHQNSDVGGESTGRGVLAHDPKLMHGVSHTIVQAEGNNSSSTANGTLGVGAIIELTEPPGGRSLSLVAEWNDTLPVIQKESETKAKEPTEKKEGSEPDKTKPIEPKMEGRLALEAPPPDNSTVTGKPGKRSIADYYGKPIAATMNTLRRKDLALESHVKIA